MLGDHSYRTKRATILITFLAASLALVTAATPASAGTLSTAECIDTPVFLDDFEQEPSSRTATTMDKWDVLDGSIDGVGDGDTFNPFPGEGRYIDMDGSNNDAATIKTKATFMTSVPEGTYLLRYELAGNQRGQPDDTMTVSFDEIGGATTSVAHTLSSAEPLAFHDLLLMVGPSAELAVTMDHAGGDNFGILLDDVLVCLVDEPVVPVPELSSGLLALIGMGLLGAVAVGWARVAKRYP